MRFNLFAGPGAGKSTTAARVFAELKMRQISVEHVGEYVKSWAYQKREIRKWDQLYVFGKQHQYEYRFLANGVKNIVTDSPCFLSVIYQNKYQGKGIVSTAIAALCKEYTNDYPETNIFLDRADKPYVQAGRYQNYDEAKELDSFMKDRLNEYNVPFTVIRYDDFPAILSHIMTHADS